MPKWKRIAVAAPILCAALFLPAVGKGGTYGVSAHGDGTYGVNRKGLTPAGVYAVGNCAHCHEQHASVDGTEPEPSGGPDNFLISSGGDPTAIPPYTVDDNPCFQCHNGVSIQEGGIAGLNYDYSVTFAGAPSTASGTGGPSTTSIMEAFNETHSHDLSYVHDYAVDNFPGFDAENNPCAACHNPHLARRNKANPTDRAYTVMSNPDSHNTLFGGGTGESIDDFTLSSAVYIPPVGEPTGPQTPDYNTFCLKCHAFDVPTDPRTDHYGKSVSIFYGINWDSNGGDGVQTGPTYDVPGDKHGMNIATGYAAIDPPYTTAGNVPADAVLSCMNCHEAHGSENDYMHRRSINNIPLGVVITGVTNERGRHCIPCHTEDSGGNQWKDTHHGGSFTNDNPYTANKDRDGIGTPDKDCDYCHCSNTASDSCFPIPCEDCHFHGSYVDEFDKYTPEGTAMGVQYIKPDKTPYRRKTF